MMRIVPTAVAARVTSMSQAMNLPTRATLGLLLHAGD
jgi:hypothetical protein